MADHGPDATIDAVDVPNPPEPRLLLVALLLTGLFAAASPAAVTGQSPPSGARSLAGRLLVATPDMRDPRSPRVSSTWSARRLEPGLVVNRPLSHALANLLERD
jgi:hypothetical protein